MSLFSYDLSVLDYKTEVHESKHAGQTSLDLPKALADEDKRKVTGRWKHKSA
jgi:hypothetical protein